MVTGTPMQVVCATVLTAKAINNSHLQFRTLAADKPPFSHSQLAERSSAKEGLG